uniref:VWFA domain-containing protein n=2 Tax=Strongyloides stercoralis TaxID=6248 RepID=A0A913HJS3_STRER
MTTLNILIIKLILIILFKTYFSQIIKLPSLNIHIIYDDMDSYTYLPQNTVKKNKKDIINFILTIIKELEIGDYHSKIAVSRFTPTLFNDIHLNSVQTSQNVINYFETFKILNDDNTNETSMLLFPPLLPSVNEIVKESFSSSTNLQPRSPAYNVILLIFYVTDQLVETKLNENLFHPNGPIFVFQITIGKISTQIKISQYTFSSLTIHYRANETKNLVELKNYLLTGIINFTQISNSYDYSTTLQLGLSTKATITILGCVGGLLLILLSILFINNSSVKQIQKEYEKKMSQIYSVVPNSDNLNNIILHKEEHVNNKFTQNNGNIDKNILNQDKLSKNDFNDSNILIEDKKENIKNSNKNDVEFDETFDILFLVDDSNSISNTIFDEYKQFINKFLGFLEISSSQILQMSRIGVITFNRKPFLNIPFEKFNSFKKLKNNVNKLNRNGGVTNLGKALNFANGYLLGQKSIEISDNSHSNDKKLLQDRLQFLILLSDGHTKDTIDWEYQSLLREYSIFMVAIISKSYLDDMFIGLVKVGGKLMSLKDSDELTKYIGKKFTFFNENKNFN